MDLLDVLRAILIISITIGFVAFYVIGGFIIIVLSFYTASYTVALFHILFIEPAIFNTYSLFTIPYNDILVIANMHMFFYWTVAVIYFIGLLEGAEKVITLKITK